MKWALLLVIACIGWGIFTRIRPPDTGSARSRPAPQPGEIVVSQFKALVDDIPQLTIRSEEGRVVLDGELLLLTDLARVYRAAQEIQAYSPLAQKLRIDNLVRVSPLTMETVAERIQQVIGSRSIKARSRGNRIYLEGNAISERDADEAVEIATAHLPGFHVESGGPAGQQERDAPALVDRLRIRGRARARRPQVAIRKPEKVAPVVVPPARVVSRQPERIAPPVAPPPRVVSQEPRKVAPPVVAPPARVVSRQPERAAPPAPPKPAEIPARALAVAVEDVSGSPFEVERPTSARLAPVKRLWKQKGAAAALNVLDQLMTQHPYDQDVLREFGICAYEAGAVEDSTAKLLQAQLRDPQDWLSTLFLGRAYEKQGNWLGAMLAYTHTELLMRDDNYTGRFQDKISELKTKVKTQQTADNDLIMETVKRRRR